MKETFDQASAGASNDMGGASWEGNWDRIQMMMKSNIGNITTDIFGRVIPRDPAYYRGDELYF